MRFFPVLLAIIAFTPIQSIAQDLLRTNITFESGRFTLHGELLLPQNSDSIPMIIFLVGSGENSSHRTIYKDFVEKNQEYGITMRTKHANIVVKSLRNEELSRVIKELISFS